MKRTYRFWTPREVALLRELRVDRMLTFAAIVDGDYFPGRSWSSITCACNTFKIQVCRSPRKITRSKMAVIRQMHALGRSIAEIGDAIRRDRKAVARALKTLGLTPHRFVARHRQRMSESKKRWLERNGMASMGEMHSVKCRARVAATGWPIDCRWRETQILDVLEAHHQRRQEYEPCHGDGMTRIELCEAAEINTDRSDIGYPHVENLLRAGLIVRRGKRVIKPGRGNARQTYALAPGVKRKRLALPTTEERRIAEMELLRRVAS